ncbi:hypothetical protein BH24ACT22_BH24ACT22_21130 [soil metagenome]
MAKEEIDEEIVGAGAIAPGLIVRHTNRRLGTLEPSEACRRLIFGSISFSEFVDQVGEEFQKLLDFMMDHDLHPGRPEDVVYCIECYARLSDRPLLLAQLQDLYAHDREPQGVG